MRRREFLKKAAIPATVAAVEQVLKPLDSAGSRAAHAIEGGADPARLLMREYGRTGIRLSVIGFGGFMVVGKELQHVSRLVADAVERGINYFDVAPTYGNAEELLGPAVEPYRKSIFLACKTTERTRQGAETELRRSLQRLRTDFLDLYQLHGLTDVKKDVDAVFAKGGALEVLQQARKDGRIRYLGFSAHSVEAAMAAMDRFAFDSILFPVNFACYYKGNFGPQVVAKAESKGVARLGLKAVAWQKWPKDHPDRQKYPNCWYQPLSDPREAALGLRFALSQPVTAVIPPADESLFRLAMDLAMHVEPLTEKDEQILRGLAAQATPVFQMA